MQGEATPRPSLYLFLGAGASVAAGVPATAGFLEAFRKSISDDKDLTEALKTLESELVKWKSATSPATPDMDIEDILGALSFLLSSGEIGWAFVSKQRPLLGLNSSSIVELNIRLHEFIRKTCLVLPAATSPLRGIERLLRDHREVHAFTVNYDIVFEQLMNSFGLRTIDGFRWKWDPETFQAPTPEPKVSIYKLHGSAIWYRSSNEAYVELPIRGGSEPVELLGGDPAIPLIMYPGRKWEYTRPYLYLLDKFGEGLRACDYLIVVGYRFRDEHLNRVLWEAAIDNPRLMLILISPDSEDVYNRVLSSERFGWTTDESSTGSRAAQSPLDGRVIRLPFKWERVVADLGSQLLADIKSGIANYFAAIAAMTYSVDTDWSEAALGLVKAHYLEPLPEVEERFNVESRPQRWQLEYLGRKYLVQASLGSTNEAGKTWNKLVELLQENLSRMDVQVLGRPPSQLQLGFKRSEVGLGPSRMEVRYGAIVLRQELERVLELSSKQEFYVDHGPAHEGAKRAKGLLARLDSYLAEFVTGDGGDVLWLGDYLARREASRPDATKKIRELQGRFGLPPSEDISGPTGDATITIIAKQIEEIEREILDGLLIRELF